MEQKFCTGCGKPVVAGAAFCAFCGKTLQQAQSVPAEEPKAQPTPQPTPQPVTTKPIIPEKPVEPAKRKGLALMASVYLCVVVFFLACTLNVIMGTRRATTPKKGADLAMSMINSVDLTKVDAAGIVADVDYEGSVADWIVDRAMEESQNKNQFDERDFEEYLEESKMIEKLTNHTGSLIWDIRNGVEGEELTTDDMRKMLKDDEKMIYKHLHFHITEKDINNIIAEMERTKALDYTNPSALYTKAPVVYDAIQYGLSDLVVLVLLLLILVCAVLLWLVNRFRIRTLLGDLGMTLALAGGAGVVGTLLMIAVNDWLFSGLKKLSFLGGAFSFIAGNVIVPAVITLILGVALFVAKFFVKKSKV